MRLLAIDTSHSVGSVAALDGGNLLAELKLPPDQGSAQSLAPSIRNLLEQVRWHPPDVRVVAVTVGPGSFTGLRIGVTTAKTFAYTVKADVLGVDTLEAIAAGFPPEVRDAAVAVDAQRGQVVAATFRRGPDGWFSAVQPSHLIDFDAWLASLPPGIAVSGPVLEKVSGKSPAQVRVLDPRYWHPTAAAVGRLAAHRYALGHRDDLWALEPRYFRRSAAEEKWEKRERRNGNQERLSQSM